MVIVGARGRRAGPLGDVGDTGSDMLCVYVPSKTSNGKSLGSKALVISYHSERAVTESVAVRSLVVRVLYGKRSISCCPVLGNDRKSKRRHQSHPPRVEEAA